MQMPLEGVRVLDLSHALAGPFCSTMLADFGAEVIKLEPKGAGDISRAWGTRLPGGETSYFVSLHRNKKGIEVDLKHARGKELFFRLMERSDVVLENYRTGALELAEHGINVNAVAPGPIDTERAGPSLKKMNETVEFSPNRMTPMHRLGQPIEVAHAVLFLASEEASYITGHTLAVAGGR